MKQKISTIKHFNERMLTFGFIVVLFFSATFTKAQNVAINTDGSKADPNAIVDIKSSSKGLLIPRMTTAQRMKIPQTNGMLVYDMNTKTFWFSNGESWQNIAVGAAAAVGAPWVTTGNAGLADANFIGTTDFVPFNVRVNNLRSGRLDPSTLNSSWGFRAGLNLSTTASGIHGTNNTAIGASSLQNTADGSGNAALGTSTLQTNVSGNYNTALGDQALQKNTVSANTAVGFQSMFNNTTGIFNTATGYISLFSNTTGQANTATGYQALYANTTGGSNVANGSHALARNTTGAGNTGIGSDALRSNTIGTWNTGVGAGSLFVNLIGNYNTGIGNSALFNNTQGNNNSAVGAGALQSNNTGTNNTAVGWQASFSNTSGQGNTAVGASALYGGNGFENTAIGLATLQNNNGSGNTAIGGHALFSNTTGFGNMAGGANSLYVNSTGRYNAAYGTAALQLNTTGNENVADGVSALFNNTEGSFNTALGSNTLNSNVTGNNNTAIGHDADVTSSALSNATAIGYNAKVNASNKVRIGNAAVTVIEGQVPFSFPSDGRYKFNVREDVSGLDFILQLRPITYQFDVKRFDNQAGNYQEGSSSNIAVQASYDEAAQIRRSGFIAQEVEKAAVKSGYDFSGVNKPKTETDHYSLSYESFVVPLVKAVQEQQQIINTQNKRMDEQERKIELLIQELKELKKKK